MTTFEIDPALADADGLILTPVGDVDIASSDDLSKIIHAALDTPGITHLLVDLRRTTFLDCTGIHALVAGHRLAADRGASLHISNPQRVVRRVLDVTGVLQALARDPH